MTLILSSNKLTGTLPPELGKHSPNLTTVEVADNELTGRIPEGLCAGGNLESMHNQNFRLLVRWASLGVLAFKI